MHLLFEHDPCLVCLALGRGEVIAGIVAILAGVAGFEVPVDPGHDGLQFVGQGRDEFLGGTHRALPVTGEKNACSLGDIRGPAVDLARDLLEVVQLLHGGSLGHFPPAPFNARTDVVHHGRGIHGLGQGQGEVL